MAKRFDHKIYHITHQCRLPSILHAGELWCEKQAGLQTLSEASIGLRTIKYRRRGLRLASRPNLKVADCVPFYFCPRSIMLYMIHKANHPALTYHGGQQHIIHLQADLHQTIKWAAKHRRPWAFTTSNAGSYYFEDYADLNFLDRINWQAVHAGNWSGPGISPSIREGKQAEFLIAHAFPWVLVEEIGVPSQTLLHQVKALLQTQDHRPLVTLRPNWYY